MSTQADSPTGEADAVQRFFRYFQLEATALQEQMARLDAVPTIGGERMDAIEHCLAGISRLQREVQDAASYTTSYDQKMYSEGVKALYEKLEETRKSLAPKQKFSFKSSVKKNNSAISLSDAAELALQQRATLLAAHSKTMSSEESSLSHTPIEAALSPSENEVTGPPAQPPRRGSLGSFLKAAGMAPSEGAKRPQESTVRKMSFASAKTVDLSSHSNVHIILPSSAAHATTSGSLTKLRHCIVDLSIPTSTGQPFAALTIKDIKECLLICGRVNGSAHVTNVQNSVIVVKTNQLRMHHCQNCVVYLLVNSRPIIEDCSAVQFAPLAKVHTTKDDELSITNQWDKVQDFNWPSATASPNWKELPLDNRVPEKIWAAIADSGPEWNLDGILRTVGVSGLGSRDSAT